MTSQDVVEGLLNSFRRQLEADPDQRWINSFNTRAMIVSKFFKWLAYPNLKQEERNKMLPLPPALKGLRFVRKKGPKSRVKNADLWTLEEDARSKSVACKKKGGSTTSTREQLSTDDQNGH